MSSEDEADLDWEFSAQERAELALDIQEAYIQFWHRYDGENPNQTEFVSHLGDNGFHWIDASNMVDEAFGSYNEMIRSLGDIPGDHWVPQDAAARAYNHLELPATSSDLRETENIHASISHRHFGSMAGMMETFGYFEEYREELDILPRENKHTKKSLERRKRDKQTLIEAVEEKLGKNYNEVETKYQIG